MPSQSICCAARQGEDDLVESLANLCHRFSRLSRNNPQVISDTLDWQRRFAGCAANAIAAGKREAPDLAPASPSPAPSDTPSTAMPTRLKCKDNLLQVLAAPVGAVPWKR